MTPNSRWRDLGWWIFVLLVAVVIGSCVFSILRFGVLMQFLHK